MLPKMELLEETRGKGKEEKNIEIYQKTMKCTEIC
jgi:hypothetical protein